MKKLLALVCAAAVALGLPGCGQKAESTPTSSLPQDAVLPLVDQADPEQAMEAIYAEVEIQDVSRRMTRSCWRNSSSTPASWRAIPSGIPAAYMALRMCSS